MALNHDRTTLTDVITQFQGKVGWVQRVVDQWFFRTERTLDEIIDGWRSTGYVHVVDGLDATVPRFSIVNQLGMFQGKATRIHHRQVDAMWQSILNNEVALSISKSSL